MKEISQLESKIIKWCNDNSILYFEGELSQESNVFSVNTENCVIEFLELGKKITFPILFCAVNISHLMILDLVL